MRSLINTQLNPMKINHKHSFAILIAIYCMSANSQYKFADLEWGSPIVVVEKKLTQLGYTFTTNLSDKIGCKVYDDCTLTFRGPSVQKGRLNFSNGLLTFVGLETGNREQTLNALTARYGQPHYDWPPNRDRMFALPAEDQGSLYWRAWNNSDLTIRKDGRVYYDGQTPTGPTDTTGHKNF